MFTLLCFASSAMDTPSRKAVGKFVSSARANNRGGPPSCSNARQFCNETLPEVWMMTACPPKAAPCVVPLASVPLQTSGLLARSQQSGQSCGKAYSDERQRFRKVHACSFQGCDCCNCAPCPKVCTWRSTTTQTKYNHTSLSSSGTPALSAPYEEMPCAPAGNFCTTNALRQ